MTDTDDIVERLRYKTKSTWAKHIMQEHEVCRPLRMEAADAIAERDDEIEQLRGELRSLRAELDELSWIDEVEHILVGLVKDYGMKRHD